MENAGKKIYNLRTEQNVSQEKLAQALNVARYTVSRWETGTAQPTIENIKSLCAYFGVDVNYFLVEETNENSVEEIALTEPETKKEPKFRALKIVSAVVGMVLLALLVTACGIAAYITISPGAGGAWSEEQHIINYEGIIIFVVLTVVVAVLITLIVLFVAKFIKNRKNR